MNTGARKELAAVATGAAALSALLGRRSSAVALAVMAGCALCVAFPTLRFPRQERCHYRRFAWSRFALARNLLRAGAKVALLARDAEELARAKAQLATDPGGKIITVRCDVTQIAELETAVSQVVDAFGGIDVWVNDAGSILVGPLRSMAREDFEALLKTQIHTVWTSTQLLLPIFQKAGGGKIVNISSIGGKLAVPHLGPYATAKFALAGLSASLNAELATENIQVTTVFPGLMRVGSAIQAVVKGDHEKEFAWFALGSMTPVISVSADTAARRIMDGVARGDAQVIFPMTMRAATLVQAVLPELTAWATRVAAEFFPEDNIAAGKTGARSEGLLSKVLGGSVLSGQLEAQQNENNETGKTDARFNLGLDSKGSS